MISFLASIAPLQSAVQVTGDGNGLRLKIDVPESELDNVLPLLALRGEILRLTIEVEQSPTYGEPKTNKGAATSPLDVAGSRL